MSKRKDKAIRKAEQAKKFCVASAMHFVGGILGGVFFGWLAFDSIRSGVIPFTDRGTGHWDILRSEQPFFFWASVLIKAYLAVHMPIMFGLIYFQKEMSNSEKKIG